MSEKQAISTVMAPAAIGPYSQAIVAGDFVYSAGQVGIDPVSGGLVSGGIMAETTQVLSNLASVLAAAGCSLDDVVKTTVYLADMATFGEMNEVYARHFGDHRPARATVEAGALPKNVAVEIDLIARIPS